MPRGDLTWTALCPSTKKQPCLVCGRAASASMGTVCGLTVQRQRGPGSDLGPSTRAQYLTLLGYIMYLVTLVSLTLSLCILHLPPSPQTCWVQALTTRHSPLTSPCPVFCSLAEHAHTYPAGKTSLILGCQNILIYPYSASAYTGLAALRYCPGFPEQFEPPPFGITSCLRLTKSTPSQPSPPPTNCIARYGASAVQQSAGPPCILSRP